MIKSEREKYQAELLRNVNATARAFSNSKDVIQLDSRKFRLANTVELAIKGGVPKEEIVKTVSKYPRPKVYTEPYGYTWVKGKLVKYVY